MSNNGADAARDAVHAVLDKAKAGSQVPFAADNVGGAHAAKAIDSLK